jgi:hypothetical protein
VAAAFRADVAYSREGTLRAVGHQGVTALMRQQEESA